MALDRRTFLQAIGAGSIGTAATIFSGTISAATIITIKGAGKDIWNREDEFHYFYGSMNGDFDVTVHNLELGNTSPYAKAGIMVRQELTDDAAHAMIRRNPAGKVSLQWRPTAGAEAISTTSGGEDVSDVDGRIPADWLRLRREGDVIEAFGSTDENDWTRIGRLTADEIDLNADTYVGLPVTSHNQGTLCTARFTDLSGINPSNNRDIGDVEVAGSVSIQESVPLITTDSVLDVRATTASVTGELTDLGGAESADCYFEYREVPTEAWSTTDTQTLQSPGSFSVRLSELTSRRYYEVRAVVDTSDGDSATGSTLTFGTPSRSNGREGNGGPESTSQFDPDDGFADPAPWLSNDTPVIKISEPTRRQLESAVSVDGPRVVVFETSGTIDLEAQNLTVTGDKLYLAGQTAPSPGITLIRGGLWVAASNCVIQHIRVRPGDADQDIGWVPDSIFTQDGSENNVVDHCTTTWSVDENLSIGYETSDTTVSNCLIAEALRDATHPKGEHNYGTLVGNDATNVALMGNVWVHNVDRNPRLKEGTDSVVVNNLVYHFGDGIWMDPDTRASIVGNVYRWKISEKPTIFGDGSAYLDDNVMEDDAPGSLVGDGITVLDDKPLWPEGLKPLRSDETVDHNLANAGARPADRTPQDERIIEQIRAGEGSYIDNQEGVGGYPDLAENVHSLNVPQSATRAWLRAWARKVEN
jgi:hypothetical protein